jgi:hypothetical protein
MDKTAKSSSFKPGSSKPGTNLPSKSAFKPIRTLVAENESIAPILRQLEIISRLQKTYADTVPTSLNDVSRVAAVEGSTIIVAVTNGNAATILKQILPRLLQQFRENKTQEQEVTSIKVIVQPTMTAGAGQILSHVTGVNSTGPISDKSMGQLVDSLADSPLKETIKRLQQQRARAETRAKKI